MLAFFLVLFRGFILGFGKKILRIRQPLRLKALSACDHRSIAPAVKIAKLVSRSGSERREKRHELLPFPDRRDVIKPNGGHQVPVPDKEAERVEIEQSARAYRLPHFTKPRRGRSSGQS
jgi:hypothetical protein